MEKMTLETICGGAVQEKIDRAIEQVSENILDPNTDQKKKRSITLTLSFEPLSEDRDEIGVSADITVKLAQETGLATRFYLSKDLRSGKLEVTEIQKGQIKGQLSFGDMEDFDPDTGEIYQDNNVVELRREAK